MERYYSTQRPITPGAYPKPEHNRIGEIVNFDNRTYCPEIEREAWGYIEYEYPITEVAADYELVPMVTLAGLNTPFERRRILEYSKNGNDVARHWYEVQHIADNLYKTKEWTNEYNEACFHLCVFLPGCTNGMLVAKAAHPEIYKKAVVLDRMKKLGYASKEELIAVTKETMSTGGFVGNLDIAFIRQFDPAFADECSAYRLARLNALEQKREQEHQEELRKEREKEIEAQKAIEAEKAKYLGWADTLSAMQYGRAKKMLEKKIRYNNAVMTIRDFIITLVKEGRTLYKKEMQTSWNSDKMKMVYGLAIPGENLFTVLKKTEYDFAEYLIQHKDLLEGDD